MKSKPSRKRLIKRFWSRVIKKGADYCWIYTGRLDKDGYGTFFSSLPELNTRSHRFSKSLKLGRRLTDEELVLHTCDNPACVNPAHLYIGTEIQNRSDCVTKKRHAVGEKCHKSKLTDKKVAKIRRLWKTGNYNLCQLGRLFRVHDTTIGNLGKGRTWRHVPC
jgi:hypothetical protein